MHTPFGQLIANYAARCRRPATSGWLAIIICASPAIANPIDHVLLIDNTIATGKFDTERRLRDGLAAFVRAMPDEDRLAIVLYEDLAIPVAPLAEVGETPRAELIDALNGLSFKSFLANPAAGLERAIYELTTQPRPTANSRILLVHAGQLRTGNNEQDAEFRGWAKKVLIDRARQHGISVDVISLGPEADLEFAQQLSEHTGGRHLALSATDRLRSAFTDLQTARDSIRTPSRVLTGFPNGDTPLIDPAPNSPALQQEFQPKGAEAATEQAMIDLSYLTQLAPPQAGSPVLGERPARENDRHPTTPTESSQSDAIADASGDSLFLRVGLQPFEEHQLLTAGLVIVSLSLVGGGLYFARRSKRHETAQAKPQTRTNDSLAPRHTHEARLVDLNGASGKAVYLLNGRLARICRNAGQDTTNVVCITIPDDVISREHAIIECRQGQYWVTDPGSNNGTFVNGERVRGSCALTGGDRVRFASFEFRFENESSSDETLVAAQSSDATLIANPTQTQVAPRPLTLVQGSEDQTVASTTLYRPTDDDDPNRPMPRLFNPRT